jgi:tubulin-specific chaperone A
MQSSVSGLAGATAAANATMERSFARTSETMLDVSKKAAVVSAAILVPLGLAAKAAIDFEDRLADVAKTTGLSGVELESFGKELLAVSRNTRSSIDELLDIGIVGGQLGVARNELAAFTKAADVFNIALGKDFSGGTEMAIASVSKIRSLFKDTRDLDISQSISRTGSAINDLGGMGAGTTENINDFVLRIGSMPDKMKSTFTEIAALGTFLEEKGVNSERGSSGFMNFIAETNKNLPQFARHLKMSAKDAAALFNQNPLLFGQKFARSLNKMSPQQMQKVLTELSLNSAEVTRVIGAMGDETDRLNKLMEISDQAFEKNTSLTIEAARKKATLAGKLQTLKNGFAELAIAVGDILLPVMAKMTVVVTNVANWITDLTRKHPTLTKVIVYTALALGILSAAIAVNTFVIGQVLKINGLWLLAVKATNFFLGIATVINGKYAVSCFATSAGMRGMAFASYFLEGAFLSLNFMTGGLLIAFGLLVATFSEGYDKSINYGESLEKMKNGFSKLKEPISVAQIGLEKYNKALEEYGELLNFINRQKYAKERGFLTEFTTRVRDKVMNPALSQQAEIERYAPGILKPKVSDYMSAKDSAEISQAIDPEQARQDSLIRRLEVNKKETVSINFGNMPAGTDVKHSKGIGVTYSSTQVMPA